MKQLHAVARRLLQQLAAHTPLLPGAASVAYVDIDDTIRRTYGYAKQGAGYRGLAKQFPDQVQAPPLKPRKDAPPEELAAWEEARKQQSSERIRVEHANAEHKQWRPLQRWIGRREYVDQTYQAIAGLVSDRTAMR